MGLLTHLGLSFSVIERLVFFYPALALGYGGTVWLLKKLGVHPIIAALAGVFFCTNPYVLVLITGGQLLIAVGYALFPWVALTALKMFRERSLASGCLAGGIAGVQAWFDPRPAGLAVSAGVVVAAVIVLAAPRGSQTGRLRRLRRLPLKAGFVSLVTFAVLQAPWALPVMLNMHSAVPPSYLTANALQAWSLMSLANGLTLFHPFWPHMSAFTRYAIPALWFFIPAGVALVIEGSSRRRSVLAGAAMFLIFSELVAGSNPPFGTINTWLFSHVPGMDLFRDPSPYFAPAIVGFTIAAAVGLSEILTAPVGDARIKQLDAVAVGGPGSTSDRRARGAITALGLTILLLVSGYPALLGILHQNLEPRSVPRADVQLDRAIEASKPGAVLWIPAVSRFAPTDVEHPNVSAVDLGQLSAQFPQIIAQNEFFPQLASPLSWLNQRTFTADLLREYGISYVVVAKAASTYTDNQLFFPAAEQLAMSAVSGRPILEDSSYKLTTLATSSAYPVSTSALADAIPDLAAHASITALTVGAPNDRIVISPAPGSSATPWRNLLNGFASPPESNSKSYVASLNDQFTKGLGEWTGPGNANNYLHDSLAQAQISATPVRSPDGSWERLSVGTGAVAIGRKLQTCPDFGLGRIQLDYRTVGDIAPRVYVYDSSLPDPLAELSLSPSSAWRSLNEPFAILPPLGSTAIAKAGSKCIVEIVGFPGTSSAQHSLDLRSISIFAQSSGLSAGPGVTGDSTSGKLQTKTTISADGDINNAVIPPSAAAQLVVFWQQYDRAWTAESDRGVPFAHIVANGWANAYVVPPHERPLLLHVSYATRHLQMLGYLLVLVFCAVVVLGLTIRSIWSPRGRRALGQRRR